MSKNKCKRDQLKQYLSTALEFDRCNINGRDVEVFDERIISKHQAFLNKKNPLDITIPLTEKISKIPSDYMLSYLPVFAESKYMQQYHFEFTNEQLKEMYTTTKIIVDKWHSTFITEQGVMHRTSFFAVAPHANTKNGIPTLYRFSITRLAHKTDEYTINMHAIVGGKPDGWLFLGRLDCGSENKIHPVLEHYMTKAYLKKHNAVVTKDLGFHLQKIKNKLKVSDPTLKQQNFCIPFPHMHQATPNYPVGEYAEKVCPKFLRKCASNDFSKNLAWMMKVFAIYDNPHFRVGNQNINQILKEEKRVTTLNENPDPQKLISEIEVQEQNNMEIKHSTQQTQTNKKQNYRVQRHKQNSRFL